MSETPEKLSRDYFKSFFEKNYLQIKNYIWFKTGSIDLAEDLAQEAFLRVWQNSDNIKLDTLLTYTYTISNNLLINEAKRKKVELRNQQFFVNDITFENPEFLMMESEFKEILMKAISDLPEKQRVVFLMNRIEKLTYAEIAQRLEITQKAVEKRIQQALLQLKKFSKKI